MILACLGGSGAITRVPMWKKEAEEEEQEVPCRPHLLLLVLKSRKGHRQGMPAASRCHGQQENHFYRAAWRREFNPTDTMILAQQDPCLIVGTIR